MIQLLEEPEDLLDEKTFVLLFCRRDCKTRTYSNKMESKFTIPREEKYATLKHLDLRVRQLFDIGETEQVSLCKYVPHKFEWEFFDPEQLVQSGKGKKKQVVKASDLDLKQFPFLLKDGDIIGCRLESENADKSDDFQTDQDLIDKADFAARQAVEKT